MDLMLLRQPGKITEVSQYTEAPAAKFDKREKKSPGEIASVWRCFTSAERRFQILYAKVVRPRPSHPPRRPTNTARPDRPFLRGGGFPASIVRSSCCLNDKVKSRRSGDTLPLLPTRLSSERRGDEFEDAVPRNNSNRRFRFDVPVSKPAQIPQIHTKKEKMAA